MTRLREFVRENSRNPNAIAYTAMAIGALTFPGIAQFATGGNADYLVSRDKDLLDLMTGTELESKQFRQRFRFLNIVDPFGLIQGVKKLGAENE